MSIEEGKSAVINYVQAARDALDRFDTATAIEKLESAQDYTVALIPAIAPTEAEKFSEEINAMLEVANLLSIRQNTAYLNGFVESSQYPQASAALAGIQAAYRYLGREIPYRAAELIDILGQTGEYTKETYRELSSIFTTAMPTPKEIEPNFFKFVRRINIS